MRRHSAVWLVIVVGVLLAGLFFALGRSWETGQVEDAVMPGPPQAGRQAPQPINRQAVNAEAISPPKVLLVADAGLADASAPDLPWREKWAGIPLDESGRTLGPARAAFRNALVATVKPGLKACIDGLSPDKSGRFDIELFVESSGDGYYVQRAEVSADAGMDVYERRCFESAFEKHILLGDSQNTVGILHHLSFPISVPPSVPIGDAGI